MTTPHILFIWPPFLTSDILPLGIPFLSAYLREKGIENIEVFDADLAYLRTIQPFWFLYTMVKRGDNILKKTADPSAPMLNFMREKMAAAIDVMEREGKKNIPWSLKSILASFKEGASFPEKKKIRSILAPLLSRKDLNWVSISVNYPEQLFFGLAIAKELKEKFAGAIHIVMGGAQITKHIDYLIKDEGVIRMVDHFVVKDGEEPLFQLLTGTEFSKVPNLYYQDRLAGAGFVFSGHEFWRHPDDFLVPDFTGFDLEVYSDNFPVIVSKGCPWGKCAFCTFSSMHDRKFFLSSVDKALEIIEGIQKKYSISDFCFIDDALLPQFMRGLAERLIQKGVSINWMTSIILSREFLDPEFCALLKRSGLKSVSFGLESASARLLKLMNKYHQDLSPEDIQKILASIQGAGIKIALCAFFGFPTETKEEARVTLDFLLFNIGLFDFVRVQPFCLEDQTLMTTDPEKFGIAKIFKEDKNVGRRLGYYFEPKEGLSQKEAIQFSDVAVRELTLAFREKAANEKKGK